MGKECVCPHRPSLCFLTFGFAFFSLTLAATLYPLLGNNWFWFGVVLTAALTILLIGFSMGSEKYAFRGVSLFFGLLGLALFFLTSPWIGMASAACIWLLSGAYFILLFGCGEWFYYRPRPKPSQHYERGYRSSEYADKIVPESEEQEQYVYPQASYPQEVPIQQ